MATEFPYAKRVAAQIWLAVSRGLSGSQPPHGIAILAGRAIVTGKPINYLYLSFFLESLA